MDCDASQQDRMCDAWRIAVVESGRSLYDGHDRKAVLLRIRGRSYMHEGLDTKGARILVSQSSQIVAGMQLELL